MLLLRSLVNYHTLCYDHVEAIEHVSPAPLQHHKVPLLQQWGGTAHYVASGCVTNLATEFYRSQWSGFRLIIGSATIELSIHESIEASLAGPLGCLLTTTINMN